MFVETRSRSVAKAVSWRVLATAATAAIVYVFTGSLRLALTVGVVEALVKMLLFFGHERAWNRVRFGRRRMRPAVLWFTGLSGSGKTMVAKRVFEHLRSRDIPVEYLDGDAVRHLFPKTGFTRPERDMHIQRAGHLAGTLEKHGVFVVASFVSPYAEARAFVRKLCRRFVEIHVATPLEVCEKRDPKGLYAKARSGEIKNFTGVNDPYEAPKNPDLRLDTDKRSVDDSVNEVLRFLDERILGDGETL